jgi:hypothetical protein
LAPARQRGRLQQEGADAFVASWDELIENIGHKTRALTAA